LEKDIGDTACTSKAKTWSMLENEEIDQLCNLMNELCFIDGLDKILGAHSPLDMKNPDENESGDGKNSLLLECFLGLPHHSMRNMDDDSDDGRDNNRDDNNGKRFSANLRQRKTTKKCKGTSDLKNSGKKV
jgi:hypothetical protein